MPYILYLLVAQRSISVICNPRGDVGARTRGGRALCAHRFANELRFSCTCDSILPHLRKIFISLSMSAL